MFSYCMYYFVVHEFFEDVFALFFFPELMIEPRILCLLSKHSTTELNPQLCCDSFKKFVFFNCVFVFLFVVYMCVVGVVCM